MTGWQKGYAGYIHDGNGDTLILVPKAYDDISDDDAEKRYSELTALWSLATSMTTLETHDHDNLQAAKAASKVMESRYTQ